MALNTKFLTAGGTLACAAAIGFFMQSSDTAERRYGEALAQPDAANKILEVQDITLTSGELAPSVNPQPVSLPAAEAQITKASAPQELPKPEGRDASLATACEMTADARPIAAAMVQLTLDAACLPNERVTIHHNGMIFTQTTSAGGTMDITVPAMAQEAVFIMAFSNGEGAVAQASVPELADFDRMVLQWKGKSGFEIHAREFGADYGDRGHIWQGTPGDVAGAVTGQNGFITRHGDTDAPEALIAEVYSFPIKAVAQEGIVDLTVEAEVTNLNCGQEIEAQTMQVLDGGEMKTRNLTLSVPDCDATGNFLVLNNLLTDLKVAAR